MQRRPREPVHRRPPRHGRRVVVLADDGAVGEVVAPAHDRVADLQAALGQPDRMKRAQRVGRLDDADAVDVPGRVLLDHVDLDAGPCAARWSSTGRRCRRRRRGRSRCRPSRQAFSTKRSVLLEALLRLLGLTPVDRRQALHHRLGHLHVLPERRPALARPEDRRLPVGHLVDPAARVDLDAHAAGFADVEVGDLVDAVDAWAELDRRAARHEHLGRALDVEALVDAVGDVVDAAGRAARSPGTRPRSCVSGSPLQVIVEKTLKPGSG